MARERGRTINSIFNILATSFGTVISLLTSFLNRIIFLHYLNATYLGVSGLFSNILLIFSLVELGIGSALTQMFYKPFAEKNYEQLSKVTYTTKVLLNIIGIVIIILTFIFTPMLRFFVNDMDAVPNMRIIFILYGLNSGITYFLGYYRTIITANQQAYKLVKIDVGWKLFTTGVLAMALAVTKLFIPYLIMQIVLNYFQNAIIKYYVKKEIPEIDYTCKILISKEELKQLMKNVTGLSLNRIALVITNGTDNIIISKFLNLVTVGLASNYTMIQQSVSSLVESVFGPLLASIGNLCVSETDATKYVFFKNFYFIAFWLYGFCSITAFSLASPFIEFVFGNEYVISIVAVFWLCIYIFVSGMCRVPSLFRTAQGLFWYGKFRPLIQAIVNFVVSLALVLLTRKLWAVYAGTVISVVSITIWYDPYIILKYGVHQHYLEFYKKLIYYFGSYFICLGIVFGVSNIIGYTGLVRLLVLLALDIVVINMFFTIMTCRMEEFKYWKLFIRKFLKKFANKSKIKG